MLLYLINKNKIRIACEVICTLDRNERKQIGAYLDELFMDAEINSSTITVYNDRVEGYEGNGHCTINDDDYNERLVKIYFNYDNTCWYCKQDVKGSNGFFCEEFDSNIHHQCILDECKRTLESKNCNDELYCIVKEWASKLFKSY